MTDYHERIVPGGSIWRENVANHMHRYRYACRFVSGMRVLDAACGVGYGSQMLLRAGANEVVGVDVADDALEIARSQFAIPGVRFVRDDCEVLGSVQGPFDLITAFECMEHFHEPRRFLGRACSLLRGSGVLVCSTPNPRFTGRGRNGRPGNPFHVHEPTLEELRELLQEHFDDVLIAGQRPTAAYEEIMRLNQLRSNPCIRAGRLLQRLLHGRSPAAEPVLQTEADWVISEANPEDAAFFVGVCKKPRRG